MNLHTHTIHSRESKRQRRRHNQNRIAHPSTPGARRRCRGRRRSSCLRATEPAAADADPPPLPPSPLPPLLCSCCTVSQRAVSRDRRGGGHPSHYRTHPTSPPSLPSNDQNMCVRTHLRPPPPPTPAPPAAPPAPPAPATAAPPSGRTRGAAGPWGPEREGGREGGGLGVCV